jgi:hypothetical protein
MNEQCNSIRDEFGDLLDGTVGPEREERLRRHLAQCAACRAEFQELRQAVQAVRELPSVSAPDGFDRRVLEQIVQSAPPARSRRVVRLALRLGPVAALFLVVLCVTLVAYRGGAVREYSVGRAPADEASPQLADQDAPAATEAMADEGLGAEDAEESEIGPEFHDDLRIEPRRRTGRLSLDEEAVSFRAESTAADGPGAAADQVLVIRTNEPERVRAALVKLAQQDEGEAGDAGLLRAEDSAYYMAVPTARYEAVLEQLARLTPPSEHQKLHNLDGPDLEVVQQAPAWHDGYREGLRKAARRNSAYAQLRAGAGGAAGAVRDSVQAAPAAEPRPTDEDAGKTAVAEQKRVAEAGVAADDEVDTANVKSRALAYERQPERMQETDPREADGAGAPRIFVTILVRILPWAPGEAEAGVVAPADSAAEEPAQ